MSVVADPRSERLPVRRAAVPRAPVAVLMSRFPKVSETFILNEILELERLGTRVEILSLLPERAAVTHPGAREAAERAYIPRPLSREVLAANAHWLRRRPRAWLGAWAGALAGNASSPGFLARAAMVCWLGAAFARRVEDAGVGHVHAHYATHPALAAWVVRRLTGTPYSFTVHAHDLYVKRPMLRRKVREAAFVRAISRYNRDLLARLYGRDAERTVVIHTGTDPDRFRPRPRARRDGPFTCVCVASLQDYKGQRYLIEACARLRDAGRPLRCLLVGEGEERPRLEALVRRLGLEDVVAFRGAQPAERVAETVASADVAVLPSVTTPSGKQEGIPVALMEALAAGVPVVASRLSGIPELVEDGVGGLLVPQRDPAALAAALARLQDDPMLRRSLAANGRRRVLEAFDLRRNAAALAAQLARVEREGPA